MLNQPYGSQEDVRRLHAELHFESSTPFGSFRVGDTMTDGTENKFLGYIHHVHHLFNREGKNLKNYDVVLYLYEDRPEFSVA